MSTNDNGNTGGGSLTDTDNIAITVTAVNDAPVNTVPGAQTTNEDTAKVDQRHQRERRGRKPRDDGR